MFYKFKWKVLGCLLLHLFLGVMIQSESLRDCSVFFFKEKNISLTAMCFFSNKTKMISSSLSFCDISICLALPLVNLEA